ncbi:MAG: ShlB/FhaC/HecB family hemolysin secretion/activation protein [Chlamydiia bacterium]|nr:ShlB/FhaC/HecB family hemolysin secretion/activation protein [Chlamydiia bacterium]
MNWKRKNTLLIFTLGLPLWGMADDVLMDSVQREAIVSAPVLLDCLQGLLLVDRLDQVRKDPEQGDRAVVADRVGFLNQHPAFLRRLSAEYIGKQLTQETLERLQEQIVNFYRSQGQPFVIVSIPRQNFTQGILQVIVSEGLLGNVTFKGNRHVLPSRLREQIRTESGQLLEGVTLVQDLARINQNPFRRTDAILRPGTKPGIVDIELATIDRWPYRFYMGADNTGTIATERDRLFFGINLGKTIVDDSEFSYQFTCSPNWNRFIAHTALCRVPCPKRQTLIFYGGYSQVEPQLTDGNAEKSISWQVDGRYRVPLITNTSFLQEIIFGYDFKQVIGKIRTGGVEVFHNQVDIDQFMIGYDLGYRSPSIKMAVVAEVYGNPGGMTTNNRTSKYQAFRTGSSPYYIYGKLSHSFAKQFANSFWFNYNINAQASTKKLLPSEQFTLAGYNAVRGFEERIVSVDNALLLNLELQSPHISILKFAGLSHQLPDEFYFLAFFDYGLGDNHNASAGTSSTVSLASVGPGVRYQIDRYVSVRFDYGIQVLHNGFENPTHSRYNFGLVLSF